ncbi:unnamed protein product [Ilex paraguariensis]|uniref:Uncharacterized protein n=1 Tax=Ilex paraguariensis TaxID=185542 RepID=A0ABC8SYG5_9AQUA
MAGRDYERSRMEHCVGLFFDPPPPPRSDDERMKSKVDKNLCRDMLRAVGEIHNKWGELPINYIEALKKVHRFKKNSKALNEFLHRNHPKAGKRKSKAIAQLELHKGAPSPENNSQQNKVRPRSLGARL